MKTSFIALAAGVLFAGAAAAAPAQAAKFAFNFGLDNVSRANGVFEYDEKTKAGVIGFEDLVAFSLTTVGGPILLEDGTTQNFASKTYELADIMGLSNRYFGFDVDTLSFAVQAFEGFAFPVVFAAYNNTGTSGFLVDFYDNGTGGGSVTDYTVGYIDGYNGVSLAAVVPEPTTWSLMIAGFAMVGGIARYRRRTTRVAFR